MATDPTVLPKKRQNECRFCSSRRCYVRIHTSLARRGGPAYDEVACRRHVRELEIDADAKAPGLWKNHVSSTGRLRRSPPLGQAERELIAIGEAVMALGAHEEGGGYALERRAERHGPWEVWRGPVGLAQGHVYLHEALIAAAERLEP